MEKLHGFPFESSSNKPLTEEEKDKIKGELEELEKVGIMVRKISISEAGAPPKYSFDFPSSELQYKTRLALEKAEFDVGQQMSDRMLEFYVSRRTSKSAGWEV